MKNKRIKQLVFAALCAALGILLPSLFHMFGQAAGVMLLPMHLPVLLCGFLCGWQYGGICGFLVPLLASLITGKPPLYPTALAMAAELCAYGLLTGLLYKRCNLYLSLLGAMLGGRIVNGVMNALLSMAAGQVYTAESFEVFLTGAFVTALPGIVIQLILIPMLVVVLQKAGLAEKREIHG